MTASCILQSCLYRDEMPWQNCRDPGADESKRCCARCINAFLRGCAVVVDCEQRAAGQRPKVALAEGRKPVSNARRNRDTQHRRMTCPALQQRHEFTKAWRPWVSLHSHVLHIALAT